MNVIINKLPHELPEGAMLAQAIALLQPTPPFAAAVNLQFVPNTRYEQTPLQAGDRVEVILPVTGG
jgi:sulfur carrier protein